MHTPPSTTSPSVNTSPPSITRNSATAIAGIATRMRAPSSERGWRSERARRARLEGRRADARGPPSGGGALGRIRAWRAPPGVWGPLAISAESPTAEPAATVGELRQRLLERGACEVGPQLVAEDELGVGRLPKQVVREAALTAGADDQVGVVHLRGVEAGAEVLLASALEASRGVEYLRAAAVVEGHEHRDALIRLRELFGPAHLLGQARIDARAAPDEAHAHTFAVELGGFASDAIGEHLHQALDLGGRPRPVLGRERVHRELLDAELGRVAQTRLDGVGTRAVAVVDRKPAGARPAAIAVGDDRDVARRRAIGRRAVRSEIGGRRGPLPRRAHQTARISSSFALSTSSRSLMRPSVSFCSSTSARCSSSEDASPSLLSSRRWCIVSRRTLRIDTRPSSASARTTLTSSRRRSSVSSGTTRRTTLPSLEGFRPTSDSLIAFSIDLIEDLS